jgi:circadian clock protein KaiC
MEREPTGITGLDGLIEGGLPKGSVTLISGSPGTGKSILCQHFICTGATKFDQRCLYLSFEQRVPEIYAQAKKVGFDFQKLERDGKVRFIFIDIAQRRLAPGQTHIDVIEEEIKKFHADRVVIDSLTPLANFPISLNELAYYGMIGEIDKILLPSIQEDLIVRMQVHKMIMMLKDAGVTSLIVSEIPKNSEWLSRDRVSEFMADGVILLHYLGIGATSNRSLTIEKLRGTKHCEDVIPLEITDKGIIVKKPEEAYRV